MIVLNSLRCLDRGVVVWLTGLPGSGKTTIARRLVDVLRERYGIKAEILDGDWVRKTINPEAGFTRDQRRLHLLRVAWIARILARNGIVVVCSFVSPYRDVRREVRDIVSGEVPFLEVYVRCSLEECIRRDPKGLYAKALRGEISNFTGVSDPYEEPENPEIVVDTEKLDADSCVSSILEYLSSRGYIEDR